jgi:Tol biopolymer transport system component
MKLLIGLVVSAATLGAQAPSPQTSATPAAQPGTDIYLVPLSAGLPSMRTAAPLPVATAKGYDNQPFFDPGGQRLLFTGNRDGKQTDIYEFDRASKTTRQLTRTTEGEFSATVPPEQPATPPLSRDGFTVIRVEPDNTQRLWQFDRAGGEPRLVLTDIKPVGYHAWVDADHLALFVLGQPATLQLARVTTGKAEVAARDIGRSLHRVPGTRLVSFVQKETTGAYHVKTIDIDSGRIETLVATVEGSADRDCAWMPDGKTLLMSSGTRIMKWTRDDHEWSEVFDAAPHKLGAISRLAVAPAGDAVAIVVAEPKK